MKLGSGPLIELRRLHRYFGQTQAVQDVSFEVAAGQVMGYIGPNGAGKTTSMRILATLDVPTKGDAFVDGFSVVNDPDRARARLGFMPDYFGTYANVNVWEYLDFFARAYGLRGKTRLAALDYVMRFTGLDELAEKPMRGLSKGMKQRLCLGRAMIHDPPVLVLDEPAAGLDPRARIQLREMIRQLAAQGKAVLISSHILTELAEMCDVVAIIERGRLLAVGSVEEMVRRQVRQQRRVSVQVLGEIAPVNAWLSSRPEIRQVHANGNTATFVHDGTVEAEADLLAAMIDAGFRVAAFGSVAATLEEVFMQVTEGRVQ
ncbi:MAG: ABC transporter ATP-binding protein [Pirellulales bacterium]|nr:ABC transporter ATP-binding protein [Pirellulales bacterium]